MGNFLVMYASRVVIYDRIAIIRLATGYNLHYTVSILYIVENGSAAILQSIKLSEVLPLRCFSTFDSARGGISLLLV